MLVCGILPGPVFLGVAIIQGLTRQGFDLTRHPISLLSLGDLGWLQITNFIVSGLLVVTYAVGMRRVLDGGPAGTWGPLLIGVYGVGMIAAGIFRPDAAYGFPPGSPAGVPSTMTWHSTLHGLSFLVVVLSLVGACAVFARRFAALRRPGWVAYCVTTAAFALVLAVLGSATAAGLLLLVAAAIMFTWLAVVAVRLLLETKPVGS
jgi:uncharacterized membrane protein YhaH (DUF805 family)